MYNKASTTGSGIFRAWSRLSLTGVLIIAVFLGGVFTPSAGTAARLKDIATADGVRVNQLIGYGLVIGLNGTGDGNQADFTTQGLVNMLEKMGVHVDRDSIKVKNVAGVMINAKLPPFVKIGQTIDVTVSSLGDASSLQGGTLIVTPLKGLDGKVYAMAQGPLSIGGFETGGGGGGVQKNHLTVARIPGGATVEREVPVSFSDKDEITYTLNTPDFTTVSRTVAAINEFLGGSYAKARDGATVDIKIPEQYGKKQVALMAELEGLEIDPDALAKVIIDERTGTVVMGEDVRIKQLALAHGNLSLEVKAAVPSPALVVQPVPANENTLARDRENRLVTLEEGATLGEVVRALNAVGVTPRDLIAIFLSIKASGALQAELEII